MAFVHLTKWFKKWFKRKYETRTPLSYWICQTPESSIPVRSTNFSVESP